MSDQTLISNRQRRKRMSLAAVGTLTAALIISQSSPALADDAAEVTVLTISSEGSEKNSTDLTITLEQPIPPAEVGDALSDMGVDPASLSIDGTTATVVESTEEVSTGRGAPGRTPGPNTPGGGGVSVQAGPTGQNLLCISSHSWADSNGTFYLQHACGGSTAPWGYRMSTSLRNIVTGTVWEHGMGYSVNGSFMGRGAQHWEADDYRFHGTFSRTYDYTRVAYDDHSHSG